MIKTKNPAIAAFAETVAMELSEMEMDAVAGGAAKRCGIHTEGCLTNCCINDACRPNIECW